MEKRSYDWLWQLIFVFALLIVMGTIYLTRTSGIKASDTQNTIDNNYSNSSAFQLEQEQARIEAKIKILKADYANDLINYRLVLNKVNNSLELTDLEKKEKLKYLNDLYSETYFKRKEDLIDQENAKLENLKRIECAKFCDASSL